MIFKSEKSISKDNFWNRSCLLLYFLVVHIYRDFNFCVVWILFCVVEVIKRLLMLVGLRKLMKKI